MPKIGPLELSVYTQEDEAYRAKRSAPPPPGRCADRIEDFFFVLRGGWNSSLDELQTAFGTMMECYRSDEGDEPRSQYMHLPRDSPLWRDHAARVSKFARLRALRQQQEEEEEEQQQRLAAQQIQQQQQQQQPSSSQQRWGWLWWWQRQPQPLPTAADTDG